MTSQVLYPDRSKWQGISMDEIAQAKKPDMTMLYEIMKKFIAAFRNVRTSFNILSNAKIPARIYLLFHATNVSALSIFQLEGLG